jgi:putative endonuclease
METARDKGFQKEKQASEILKEQGYEILEKNFHALTGEIDIIAKHKGSIVFVEVKYRKDLYAGTAQEAVTASKKKKIIKTAIVYIKQKHLQDQNIRFDVFAISPDGFEIIESAFTVQQGRYYI